MKRSTAKLLIVIIVIVCFVIYLQHRSSKNSVPAGQNLGIQKKSQNISSTVGNFADEVASLQFANENESINTNDKFALNATLDAKGKKISAVELHIVFNAKMLKLENIGPSKDFPLVLFEPKIDNDNGTASIVIGVPPGQNAMTGSVSVAILNFQAISAGESEVSFSQDSVAAAEGATGNVIASREGESVTVK